MKFKSIRSHFSFYLLSFFVLFVLILFFSSYFIAENIREKLAIRYGNVYSKSAEQRITSRIKKYVDTSLQMAEVPAILRWLKSSNPEKNKKHVMNTLRVYKNFLPGGTDVFIVRNDNLKYYLNEKYLFTLSKNNPNNKWYFRTIKIKNRFDLNIDDTTLNTLKLYVNVPVKHKGRILGMIGIGKKIGLFIKEVLKTDDKSVFHILVNSKGLIKAHRNKDFLDKKSFFELLDDKSKLKQLKRVMKNRRKQDSSASGMYVKINNEYHYVNVGYIDFINWYLLFFVKTQEIVKFSQFVPLIITGIAAFIIFFIIILFFTNKLIIKPVIHLTQKVEKLSEGDYETEMSVDSFDELGRLKLSFNNMAGAIKDYTTNLEEKVKQRTLELKNKNVLITDSINYAKRIQTSILPSEALLSEFFKEYFIYWQPKDIVGGDFYWMKSAGSQGFYFAVGDCTGHGVPGALMTMLSVSILNSIVEEETDSMPGEILLSLDSILRKTLNIGTGDTLSYDGLEIALCFYKPGDDYFTFSSSRLILFESSEHGVEIIKGDRHKIGYRFKNKEKDIIFHNNKVPVNKDSIYYISTDGYYDQEGADDYYPMGKKKFAGILKKMYNYSIDEQRNIVEQEIKNHMGDKNQRDDFTVMAFKL